ncbi:hypothetical protein [Parabacteroides sp.]|uniref:hypothetical protein n=1 Tax=Parabacteroides sp. TaxID=1869337 RepID=UPI002580A225|nr:hypothetical protein [Parabacteroides sp.]
MKAIKLTNYLSKNHSIRTMKRNLKCIGISLLFLTSCASIPKATVEMSVQLEQQLYALKQANNSIIENVYKEKENNVIEYVDNIWYPQYLKDLFQNPTIVQLWNEVVTTNKLEDRMEMLLLLTNSSMKKYQSYKSSLLEPIKEEKAVTLKSFNNEYDLAIRMNAAIMRNVASSSTLQEEYKTYVSKIISPERLDSITQTSLQKVDKQLDNIQKGLDAYDKSEEKIKEIINKLKK